MADQINEQKFDREINEIFAKISFEPRKVIVNSPKSLHLIVKGCIGNVEVLFKSYGNFLLTKADNITREGQIGEAINKINQTNNDKVPTFELIKYGKSKNYSWLIRKYYEGNTLGINSTCFSDALYIDRFTHLDHKFVDHYKEIINKIYKNLILFRDALSVQNKFFQCGSKRFVDQLNESVVSRISNRLNLDLDKQSSIFNENQESLLYTHNIQASIGDLTPTNIFLKNNGDVLFYDLEWFGVDNYMTDVTFFWLLLWRYPEWQNEIIKIAVKNNKDEFFFLMNTIRIIISLFYLIFNEEDKTSEQYKKSEQLCQRHIWREYLKASGESFEAIMKVKKIMRL